MGWEQRSGNRYYYRKERKGRRVISTYHGRGTIAALLAELDALDRERRQRQRAEAQMLDQNSPRWRPRRLSLPCCSPRRERK